MKIEKIPDFENCYIIRGDSFEDDRGSFVKVFNAQSFLQGNLNINFLECLYTTSKKDVIRGMHYQPNCSKLIWVSQGTILDVIVCVDVASTNFGKSFSIALTETDNICFYVGDGYAHGFKCVGNTATVNYLLTDTYSKELDKGINLNSFNFDWNIKNPIISDKDKLLPTLKSLRRV